MKYLFIFLLSIWIITGCSIPQQPSSATQKPSSPTSIPPTQTQYIRASAETSTPSAFVMRIPTSTSTPDIYPSPLPYSSEGQAISYCSSSDLEMWIGDNAAMGEILLYVGVKNISNNACIAKAPIYLSIHDQQDEAITTIEGNGNGALFEALLAPEARDSIVFSWSGCLKIKAPYVQLHGKVFDKVMSLQFRGYSRCADGVNAPKSALYASRLTESGTWLPVIVITPTAHP